MKVTSPALFRLGRLLRACPTVPAGTVSLVGAGPGDPGLLTLKAARRLGEADVVYHDALVSKAILELCRPGARLVPVGKRRGSVTLPQEAIVHAMVLDAEHGRAVVRLKGGDPFVFGRGGEEASALLERGIAFEIVPGVCAGTAVATTAGIPLTHRGVSGSVAFVTAHDLGDDEAGAARRARLSHLARGADTLVIFMGGAELSRVRRVLTESGVPAATPAAVIESGTLPEQRIVRCALSELGEVLDRQPDGPVLTVIGRSVAIGDALRAVSQIVESSSDRSAEAMSHG